MRDDLNAGGDTGPDGRAQLADAYLKLASLNRQIGSQADALKAYDESTTLFDRLFREVPLAKKHEYLLRLARALGERGELQSESKNMNAAAFDSLRRSRELLESALREKPEDAEARKSLALVLNDLASLEGRKGNVNSALDTLKTSRTLLEEGHRRAPEDIALQSLLANAHLETCDLLEEQRTRLKDAQGSAQAARLILEPLVLAHPDSVDIRQQLSRTYRRLGLINQRQGAQDRRLRFTPSKSTRSGSWFACGRRGTRLSSTRPLPFPRWPPLRAGSVQ